MEIKARPVAKFLATGVLWGAAPGTPATSGFVAHLLWQSRRCGSKGVDVGSVFRSISTGNQLQINLASALSRGTISCIFLLPQKRRIFGFNSS
jgi:hypothetical protein